jgi:rSAM/selenodomain-associated transferase 1
MSLTEERLVVFAKAPRLGQVKTRLCPPLNAESALELHCALVEQTISKLERISRPDFAHWVFVSEALEEPSLFKIPDTWTLRIQRGKNLGERLENAFRTAFEDGVKRIVVVGSDSPTVPLECIDEAFEELTRHDVVIGPALDGGYYLLGSSRFVPELFRDISWGGPQVLQETDEALIRTGRSFTHLIPWYDIDTDEDLVRLREEIAFFERLEPDLIPRLVDAVLPEEP